MMNKLLIIAFALVPLVSTALAKSKSGPVYADPIKAAEDPDFGIQGEYAADGVGVQIVALGDGQFSAMRFNGGLPGAGWDGAKAVSFQGSAAAMHSKDGQIIKVKGGRITMSDKDGKPSLTAARVERKSPTLGLKPPPGAVILFNGDDASKFKNGGIENNLLKEGTETKDVFGSFDLHIEFRTPFKPETKPGSQDRGNSGVYIFNNYETQILDSFGIKPEFNFCGSLYRFKTTDVNMCLPPLAWQTYDIQFTAPVFKNGEKVKNARITTRHNGVLIHDDVELPHGTGAGKGRPEKERGPIILQGHGNPVRFRNIWIKETTK